MNRHRQRGFVATLAALSVPAVFVLSAAPSAVAATVLAAEGTTRPRGEAQTAFNGAFCEQNTCRSLGFGPVSATTSARQIQTGVDTAPGDIILVGYSLGASGMYDRMREWESDSGTAPAPERVLLIVTYGSPENKFGGIARTNQGAGLPAEQPYQHLDVVAQYDGVADRPARFGFYSWINGMGSRHFTYFEDVDINDPGNLVFQEGTTTYMLIEVDTLPMLRWVQPFVSAERMAELDAKYRPLVERDYDRPDYIEQGEGADWGNGNPPPSVSGPEPAGPSAESESLADTSAIEDEPSTTARMTSSVRSEEESGDDAAEVEADLQRVEDDDPDGSDEGLRDGDGETEGDSGSGSSTTTSDDDAAGDAAAAAA